jgi:hypothetical protein
MTALAARAAFCGTFASPMSCDVVVLVTSATIFNIERDTGFEPATFSLGS